MKTLIQSVAEFWDTAREVPSFIVLLLAMSAAAGFLAAEARRTFWTAQPGQQIVQPVDDQAGPETEAEPERIRI